MGHKKKKKKRGGKKRDSDNFFVKYQPLGKKHTTLKCTLVFR